MGNIIGAAFKNRNIKSWTSTKKHHSEKNNYEQGDTCLLLRLYQCQKTLHGKNSIFPRSRVVDLILNMAGWGSDCRWPCSSRKPRQETALLPFKLKKSRDSLCFFFILFFIPYFENDPMGSSYHEKFLF